MGLKLSRGLLQDGVSTSKASFSICGLERRPLARQIFEGGFGDFESTLLRRFAQRGPSGSFEGFNANLGVFEKFGFRRVVFSFDHTLCKTLVDLFTFFFLKMRSLSSETQISCDRLDSFRDKKCPKNLCPSKNASVPTLKTKI